METVKVRIFENGLIGLLNRCDFNPAKHRLIEDEEAEATAAEVGTESESPAQFAEPEYFGAPEPSDPPAASQVSMGEVEPKAPDKIKGKTKGRKARR
jgi:hypothetical protein